jgi:hypothetical protein
MGLMLDQVPHGRKLAQYEKLDEPLPCPLCNAPYETLEHVLLDCPALAATRAEIKEAAFHPYLLQGNPRSSSSRPLPKQIKKYMNLLLKHAFTGDALSLDVEAVVIWLARPQNTTLEQLDLATNAMLDKDTQQRLKKEFLKAIPHLTRSAKQLWQERCQRASIINGTGTGSPYPMTVSAYSPGTYVSTMTDFFETKSTGVAVSPTPLPESGQNNCLFSQNSTNLPGSSEVSIDRPSGAATLSTQSTVQNTSQLEADNQTITDEPDRHQEVLPLITPLQKAPPRTNPVRSGRPPEGNTEHLTILLDTVGHGKLPEGYQPTGLPPCAIIRLPGDT